MGLIPNDWKHLLRPESFQKYLSKTFSYNNKVTRKVKDFKKLSNKNIYCCIQPNSVKYDKPFKFISWTNVLQGHYILSPDIWGKTFSGWLAML